MFDFNKWVIDNLISGVKNNIFPREWAAVQAANYYIKGRLTDEDMARFEKETAVAEDVPEDGSVEDMDGQEGDDGQIYGNE